MLKPGDLTPHQKELLVSFVRTYRTLTNGNHDGVRDVDFGSKRGLEHLEAKGAIRELRVEYGPRGGARRVMVATPDGLRVADYINVNGLKTWR